MKDAGCRRSGGGCSFCFVFVVSVIVQLLPLYTCDCIYMWSIFYKLSFHSKKIVSCNLCSVLVLDEGGWM